MFLYSSPYVCGSYTSYRSGFYRSVALDTWNIQCRSLHLYALVEKTTLVYSNWTLSIARRKKVAGNEVEYSYYVYYNDFMLASSGS